MSKALIIKGANFSANKVETVTIGESVPCTGISLSESAIALDTLNETVTLVATLTPSNTTDDLSWSSSDENVATVADGVVTCVGVGSATVTATCGNQNAMVSVSCSDLVTLNDIYSILPGYRYSGSLDLSATPPHDGVGLTADQSAETFYSDENTLNGYRAFICNSSTQELVAGKYPIPIPSGSNQMTITVPATVVSGSYRMRVVLLNASEQQTYVSGAIDGNAAKGVGAINQNSGTDPLVINLSNYLGANAFVVSVKDNGNTTPDNIGDVTVKFERV